MDEYLDVYDGKKNKLGIVIPRTAERELPDGQYILITVLVIENSENKIMIQVTSKAKGNVLALPGGHVLHNETSQDAIVREVFEEQGINVNKKELTLLKSAVINAIALADIYYLKQDFNLDNMVLQKEEVEDVIWMSCEEIFSAYKDGKVRKSTILAMEELQKIKNL